MFIYEVNKLIYKFSIYKYSTADFADSVSRWAAFEMFEAWAFVNAPLCRRAKEWGIKMGQEPGRPKLLITPIFHDFSRFFPFSPGLLAVLPGSLASRR